MVLPFWYWPTQVVLEKMLLSVHLFCFCLVCLNCLDCLQCFDNVGWAAERASGL